MLVSYSRSADRAGAPADYQFQQTASSCNSPRLQNKYLNTMSPPVVVVLGATGMQGGGVVAALQKQGKFAIRAVTRNAQKAKALADQGVEVVEADMNDKESLKRVPARSLRRCCPC